jgi:hypothetical protein
VLLACGRAVAADTVLFVGNSFTYGAHSPVQAYRPNTVTDLNGTGVGGVPAVFKSLLVEVGIERDVYLETHPAVGLDWHLKNEHGLLDGRPWDVVILQSHSLLDARKPGDSELLIDSVKEFAALLRARNPAVVIRLTATWPRADQIYPEGGAWHGKSVDIMAHDLRSGTDAAAAATPGIRGVVGVGDAWVRAMHDGLAQLDPYKPPDGKMDLWADDHYHASSFGYYLEALMLFGSVTGLDPRSLGPAECAGFELGLTKAQVDGLQKTAAAQLTADHVKLAKSRAASRAPAPCRAH